MSEKQKAILDGLEAEKILESEVFKKALESLKSEYIAYWLSSRDIDDVKTREDLHRSILLLPEIERHLRIIAEKGKITKHQVNKLK